MKKIRVAIVVGCLLLALTPFGCCLLVFYPRHTREAPALMGVRTDAQGNVVQPIILETTYTTRGPFLGGHGPWYEKSQYSRKYFLEKAGKPRLELTFLGQEHISEGVQGNMPCCPVDNSPLWVAVYVSIELWVVVFDETQVVHRRRFEYTSDDHGAGFNFENGNRTLVYRTVQGLQAYDITTDTLMPRKPAKN
jgi:hypothetical protein